MKRSEFLHITHNHSRAAAELLGIILCMAVALTLTGCHSNDAPERDSSVGAPLYPVLGVAQIDGTQGQSRAGFTVDDNTYYPYVELYPTPNKERVSIGVFLVTDETTIGPTPSPTTELSGIFAYNIGNVWTTTVSVKSHQYYLYGFMPANLTPDGGEPVTQTIEKKDNSSSWSDGAVITLGNFPTVTDADVSVIVGVKKGEEDPNNPGYLMPIDDGRLEIRQGEFDYKGEEKDNYIYLLLNHIYTNVNLELTIDEDYDKLRTIKITQVEMVADVISTNNLILTFTQGDHTNPVDIKYDTTSAGTPPAATKLFPRDGSEELELKVATSVSVPGYFAPAASAQGFIFTFYYDVYDKQGNLVRKGCTAKNTWSLPSGSTVAAGKSFRVPIMVKPTYLYQLSNPDLDNPTFAFN